jgi:lysozyme
VNWADIAVPLVARFEGCAKRVGALILPYLDRLAKPNVWTRGYGRTYGITEASPGITPDEAKTELRAGLSSYAGQCLKLAPALAQRPECLAAVSSWAWNCGVGAFRHSRLRRAINEGRWDDAAELIKRPRTAGGVELRGLARRRDAEAAIFARGAT